MQHYDDVELILLGGGTAQPSN